MKLIDSIVAIREAVTIENNLNNDETSISSKTLQNSSCLTTLVEPVVDTPTHTVEQLPDLDSLKLNEG